MTRARLRRVFWTGAVAILVAAALVALVAVLRGRFSDTDGRILGTLAAVLSAGSTLVAGLALREQPASRPLALGAIAVAPVGLALLAYAIWDFVSDGAGDSWRYGWTGALALAAALIAATARLLARTPMLVGLAYAAGALAVAAATLSTAAIWQHDPGSAIGKAIAALWILAALAWLLVPSLERWSLGESPTDAEHVLAVLGDVELVASRRSLEGVVVEGLPAPGERLVLRRRRAGT